MDELRKSFFAGRTASIKYRINQLDKLYRCLDENTDEILDSLHKDLRKCKLEGTLEVEILKREISDVRRNISKWGSRKWQSLNLVYGLFDTAFIQRDPYGVVLIIGPWNYPILLSLLPFIGAIAGGNCVILKPSENAPYSSSKLAELIPNYLDSECYRVVEGGIITVTELLDQKFDYIFLTGSTIVGKSVMQSAAKYLTPVTLELGGKSPVYIDDNCDMDIAVQRVLWGKFLSMGQICISPDYILCSKKVERKFVEKAQQVLLQWYGKDPQRSPDLARIINSNHFLRLWNLLHETQGQIVVGGTGDIQDLFISPTIVVNIKSTDVLMQDEIFGPILPIYTVESKEEAVQYINQRPKPLALYVFSRSRTTLDFFTNNTSSGTVCGNDVIVHATWQGMPFGGVGSSGIGQYIGKHSYKTFTHPKSVLYRNQWKIVEFFMSVRYSPYNAMTVTVIGAALKYLHWFNLFNKNWLSYLICFILGMITSIILYICILTNYISDFSFN